MLFVRWFSCLLMLLIVPLSGCFLWPDPEPESSADSDEPVQIQESEEEEEEKEAVELKDDDAALSTEAPEPDLIRISKRVYQAGMYSVAQDSLDSLRNRYPLGAYGSWAAIKAADAYYYNGQFDKAANFYEEFLKNYPGSEDTPYVKLQAARAHLSSAKGVGRDRQPLERALLLFDELDRDYPNTPYAVIARSERTPALNKLTEYDQFIIEFYRKKGNDAAVAEREKMFQERWGSRTDAGEFNKTSEEIPLEPLPAIPAQEAAALAREESPAAESFITPPEIIDLERVAIQQVECDTEGTPFAMIELSRFPEIYSAGHVIETLHPADGVIRIPGIKVSSTQPSYNCFGEDDIAIGQNGELAIRSDSRFILTTLDNPTRILLTKVVE